jgi:hypothetical protein
MDFEHLHDIPGIQFMPVKVSKQPIVKGWQTSAAKHSLKNCEAVGMVCGQLSGNLEVVDIDEKYSLDGKLFEKYKKQIHSADKNLLKKLVVQKTKGGGYHFLYRCSVIAGNLKLANRSTTEKERKETFDLTYKAELAASKPDDEAKKKAQKASDNDKVRVLFETRGEGGYIMCHPSPGYEIIHGDYYSITEITPEERETLHTIARQFNEVVEDATPYIKKTEKKGGLSPFDDYNERGDIVGFLESNGWTVVGRKGSKTIFKRPGQTTAQTSGNYDHDRGWFSVFTTSTEFEPMKAYKPCYVFAALECGNDYVAAAKKLSEMGYGEQKEVKAEKESTRKIPSRINADDDDYSFLATPDDYDGYLKQVRDGTLPQGLSTGVPSLDNYFLFKEGNFVMTNGHDNAGKSVIVWWLALISSMLYGWNWIIFSSENTLGGFMRKMIQFYWGKQLYGKFAMSQEEYEIAKKFIEQHFSLIKSEEDMFNYKDIINMMKKSMKKKKYHAAMIDPYNSLKIDLSGFSKLSTHEFHYEALSDLKFFGKKNNIGLWINHHAVTAALRAKDGEKKYPVAPQKADTEGGGKVSNKADEFLTIHRLTQHPTDWNITEIHVRKIKDTDTGGRVTGIDEPVKLEMYKGGCGFREKNIQNIIQVDPVEAWHLARGVDLKKLNSGVPVIEMNWQQQSYLPYKDDTGNEVGF